MAEVQLDRVIIPDEHLVNVCKYRQEECCKYIIFMSKVGQFCCAKNVHDLKIVIESQQDMKAVGDNCEGILCDETDP